MTASLFPGGWSRLAICISSPHRHVGNSVEPGTSRRSNADIVYSPHQWNPVCPELLQRTSLSSLSNRANSLDPIRRLFSIRSHDQGAVDQVGTRDVRGPVARDWRRISWVVRQDRTDHPTTWLASVNTGYVGEYFDRAMATARVEDLIEHNMKAVLEDWELYRAIKENRTV
jgi:hypothetical protein